MSEPGRPGIAPLPLLAALGVMLLLTAWPRVVIDAAGRVDHLAALCFAWAMSAGFVRGVGFVPQHALPRRALSGAACTLALALAVWRLWRG